MTSSMRDTRHHHSCVDCRAPAPCDGTLRRNYDGIPEVICDWFHERGGRYEHRCERCQAAFDQRAAADLLENEPEDQVQS